MMLKSPGFCNSTGAVWSWNFTPEDAKQHNGLPEPSGQETHKQP
jgi:hypothetical protein